MKIKKIIYTAVVLAFTGMPAAVTLCYAETPSGETSIEDVKQKTQSLLETLKNYTAEQRDEAMQKSKAALDSMDKRIEALETQVYNTWDKMDKAAREKSQNRLRTQAAEWYGSLKNSSSDAWGNMKKGFSEAYLSLQDAWEKSEKEISPDEE